MLIDEVLARHPVQAFVGENRVRVNQVNSRGRKSDGSVDLIDSGVGAKAERIKIAGAKEMIYGRTVIAESPQTTGNGELKFSVVLINARGRPVKRECLLIRSGVFLRRALLHQCGPWGQ